MKKRVLLLYLDYYHNRPIGIDLDNPKECIRIVADDGDAGEVQCFDIDFAKPLDVIIFDGHPVPQGKQQENWAIDNYSCKSLGKGELNGSSDKITILNWVYKNYGYHGFWNSTKPYLDEAEFEAIKVSSVSILKVSEVSIYHNDFGKSKIDFKWSGHKICGISMANRDYFEEL